MAMAQAWVQVEARPNQNLGLERANDYASRLPDVNGFRLRSGWYAVALGPYSEAEAQEALRRLRATRAIPSDSFISDGSNFRETFFGTGDRSAALAATPAEPLEPLQPGEETQAEARAGERQLTREDRELIQIALKWDGFYNSIIDASFGPGTRRAMAAWQEANRFEPTGILTTAQRRTLTGAYLDARASLGLETIAETQAGIDITIPAGLVRFDRYEAPFAHFEPATDDGVKVVLISQEGDSNTMAALYDIMQTLEIVPMEGRRNLGREEFTLTGQNDKVISHTFARAVRGTVKGFTLIWPADDEKRFRLALAAMEESFRPTDGFLPDTLGSGAPQNIDLLAGLQIRRPDRARSGFFVNASGAVLTTFEAVDQCGHITINEDIEADIAASDATLGLAILRPREPLAPLSVARLAAYEPRIQSDIAVAGFPFGGILSAPVLTYGILADVKGLDGDANVQRLEIAFEDGKSGGPVFDGSGAVAGLLLPRGDGTRQLPESVAFAADAPVLAEFLSSNGIEVAASDASEAMAPEDLTVLAADMTVLVSCWK
ncbi:MAG: peptidoglycan-binding protein [Rhodobacteraceae bacterium]|nr:MAG: peptidoglycan-binding protein [Paracoccaceae bacterium]